jgi:hypothetical protein
MSTVRELHNRAMILALESQTARDSGWRKQAITLASQAMSLEAEAAGLLAKEPSTEPTRSILYRSAAALAYQAGDYVTALRLAADGLSGYPPPTVQQELIDLFEQITMAEHLRVRGAELDPAQVQLSLAGQAVGHGLVPFDTFRTRIEAFLSILKKSALRSIGAEFKKDSRQLFVPIISAPRPGSFSVTVELAYKPNVNVDMFVTQGGIIDDVAESIALFNAQNFDQLRARIEQEDYYIHFLAQAKRLAPDGERISHVGITTPSRSVSLTLTSREVNLPHSAVPVESPALGAVDSIAASETPGIESVPRSYSGVLVLADRRGEGVIGLLTDEGETLLLTVQSAMDEYVRSFFGGRVEALVLEDRKARHLQDLNPLEGDD